MTEEQAMKQAELTKLKATADDLGITYSPNIGVESLKARIAAHAVETDESVSESNEENVQSPVADLFKNKSLRDDNVTSTYEANKLVRIELTSLDPDRTAWEGEVLCVGNSKIYFRKYIKYATEYHVPQALIDVLKDKTYTKFITEKNKQGQDVTRPVQAPAYNIKYLDPISVAELEAIKQNQLIHKDK